MALDKFQPYLFVSAGEQSNKYLTPAYVDGIAQFQAQRAQELTGLTVRIDPIQEGTGDPSPTNIRPISGRTGMTVTRAGKNLLNKTELSRTTNGITWTVNSDGTVTANGTATAGGSKFGVVIGADELPRETNLYFSGCPSDGSASKYNVYIWNNTTNERAKKWNNITAVDTDTGESENNELYLTSNHEYQYNMRVMPGQTVSNIVFKPMIRLASVSDGTYAPYVGTTYPVSWQTQAGTVYGGTLDVVSGVLIVEWDYIASYDGETLPGEWISDRDVYEEGTTPTAGAEVAYKLAEPVTYQLTPTDIKTLAGFNQIYSDAGPVIDIKF